MFFWPRRLLLRIGRLSRAWRDGRQAELVDYLAKWVEQNPAGRSAYEQYLSALIRSDEIAKAETLARTWLKAAQIAGELPAALAQLGAQSVRQVVGSLEIPVAR